MCECGCSMGGPDYRFIGPSGYWYGIRIYGGCRNCDAPAGVDVFKMDGDQYRQFDGKHTPLLEFNNGMASLAVLHPRQLIDAAKRDGMEIDEDAYGEGEVADIITSAVSATKGFYDREREEYKKRIAKERDE